MYNWKGESDTSTKHVGFIAQQVEQLFPDLVTIDNKTNLRTLNYSNFTPYIVQSIKELSNKAIFANIGSSTLINNTLQTSLNDLSLFIASTTDNTIVSTTLTNLHDLFSTSSLSAIKALTNTLTQTGFDLNLNGNALTNVKSIQSMSGNWRIGEDGTIYANTLCLKNSSGQYICVNGDQLQSLTGVSPSQDPVIDTINSTSGTSTNDIASTTPDFNISLDSTSTEIVPDVATTTP
jgi:hypothetical protein